MAHPPTTEPHLERPGPAEFRDPLVRREMAKAAVWLGMALLIVRIVVLAHPLVVIVRISTAPSGQTVSSPPAATSSGRTGRPSPSTRPRPGPEAVS